MGLNNHFCTLRLAQRCNIICAVATAFGSKGNPFFFYAVAERFFSDAT